MAQARPIMLSDHVGIAAAVTLRDRLLTLLLSGEDVQIDTRNCRQSGTAVMQVLAAALPLARQQGLSIRFERVEDGFRTLARELGMEPLFLPAGPEVAS